MFFDKLGTKFTKEERIVKTVLFINYAALDMKLDQCKWISFFFVTHREDYILKYALIFAMRFNKKKTCSKVSYVHA